MKTAYIKSISYYLPDQILTNEDLVRDFPEWTVEKVAGKLGIDKRHISAQGETAGDMAEKAALNLFAEWQVEPSDIDFVILCTQSPDYFLPTTACILQERLNIPTSAGAFDFNLGCSGYIYGLAISKGLILAGIAKNILLLTAETYSKHIHPKDKGNRTIFGDAASATLISHSGFARIGEFVLGTDGKGCNNLVVRTGGMRESNRQNKEKIDENGSFESADHLYMNGSEIFSFTQERVPELVKEALSRNGKKDSDISLYVFHQANKYMLDFLRKKMKIEEDKFFYYMSEVGNTVSSTIPIALYEAVKLDKPKGDIMLAGFGVGYSWGATLLNFG